MRVGIHTIKQGSLVPVQLQSPLVNNFASDFISNNYTVLHNSVVPKMGVEEEFVHDLICDVWKAIKEQENNGSGFYFATDEHGCTIPVNLDNERQKFKGDILGFSEPGMEVPNISLSQFIFGRMKGYSKNPRYSGEAVEKSVVMKPKLDKDGNMIPTGRLNNKGEMTYEQEIDYSKSFIATAASSSGNDDDENSQTGVQHCYANAEGEDEIDAIDTRVSLQTCLDTIYIYDQRVFKSQYISVLKILTDIQALFSANQQKRGMKTRDSNVMKYITAIVCQHPELGNALRTCIEYSNQYPDNFKRMVYAYQKKRGLVV